MAGFTVEIPYKVQIPGRQLVATRWKLATDERMENLLVDEISKEDLYFKRFNYNLDNNTKYYVSYQFILDDGSSTVPSRPALVTKDGSGTSIPDAVIKTPKLNVVDVSQTDVPLGGFVVEATPFELLLGNGEHYATDWIIEDAFGNTIFKNENDKSNLTSIRIPDGFLRPNTYYIIKARYRSDRNVYSNYGKLSIITNDEIADCDTDISLEIQNTILRLTDAFITLQNEELELRELIEG